MKTRNLVLFLSFVLINQILAQEIQIPFLPETNLMEIDQSLQKKLHLFQEYKNFYKAQLFQVNDSSYVLEITYKQHNNFLKQRIPYSPGKLKTLRQTIRNKLTQIKQKKTSIDHSGRTKFLIATTVLSAGFYGWALPEALKISNDKLGVALYMVTASSGFFLPYYLTKNTPVSDAAATLAIYGGTRGIAHGILLSELLLDKAASNYKTGFVMLTSLAELVGGIKFAGSQNYTAGTSETIGVCGDTGFLVGAQIATVTGFFDENFSKAAKTSLLLGSVLGMAGGATLAHKSHYTRGDAYVLSAAIRLGSYVPFAIVNLTNSKKIKHYALGSLVGTLAGIWMGHRLTRNADFSTGQGRMIELGEWAGGLLGFGLAYLITPSNSNQRSKAYFWASSIGAVAGFWGLYHAFAAKARISAFEKNWDIHFAFQPAGLLGVNDRNGNQLPIPLFNCNVQF